MKSVKIVIATLIAIALMVTPIAICTLDDTQSEAADFSELTELIGDIDFEKLMEVDYNQAHAAADENISGEQIVTNKQYLNKNFIFDNGATITVYPGASLYICPNQTFSFSSTGTGGIILMPGSHVYLVVDGEADNPLAAGNIISDYEVDSTSGESTYFTGKLRYEYSTPGDKPQFVLSADAGTKIKNSNTAQAQTLMEFPTANNITLKIDELKNSSTEATVKANLTAALNVKAPTPEGDATIDGNLSYSISVEGKDNGTQVDSSFTFKGDNELNINLSEYTGKIKDHEDFTIKVTQYKDTTKDPKTSMSGNLWIELSTDNVDKTYTDEETKKPISTVKLRDGRAKYNLNFDNEKLNGEMDVNVGQYLVTVYDEDGDETTNIENARIYGKYEAKFSFADINNGVAALASPVTAMTSTSALSLSSSSSSSNILTEYMKGIRPSMSEGQVKAYASDFFLGKIDKSAGFDQAGITTTRIKAEVSVGQVEMATVTVSGLTANLEISESNGFTASIGVDKLISVKEDEITHDLTKTNVGSSNISLSTSVNGKSVFDCEFTASLEQKSYVGGTLVTNPYFKNLKGKMTIGGNEKTESLTADEVAMVSYGITIKATNLSYDDDWKAFIVNEVSVNGNYYGTAPIRNIEGSYKNVTMSLNTSSAASSFKVDSVDLHIYGLNGDRMDYTRSYDSTQKVIVNNFKVDGQMFFGDFMNYTVLAGIMAVPISGTTNTTKEVNYFDGGVLFPGGSTSTQPGQPTVVNPGVTITDKEMSLNNYGMKAKAPSQVFLTTAAGYYDPSHMNDYPIRVTVNGETKDANFKGVSLGVALDENGAVSYSLMALPGYTLPSGMTKESNGFTVTDYNEKTAKIKDLSATVSCSANPIKYKIKLDGNQLPDEYQYGTTVPEITVPSGTLFVVDNNGAVIGNVNDTKWSVGTYYFTKDLDVKTVTGTTVTDVKKTEMNKVDASAVKFTVPAGGTSLQFTLSSNVRFDLNSLTPDDNIELVAQKTNFNGHDGFLIKANKSGGPNVSSTIYIPASGSGKKLMHVDEYGRASERQAELVTIDGEHYLKTTTDDYSIFYEEADTSPVLPSGGNGPNWLLIGIGALAAVAVIAGVVIIIKKR